MSDIGPVLRLFVNRAPGLSCGIVCVILRLAISWLQLYHTERLPLFAALCVGLLATADPCNYAVVIQKDRPTVM